MLVAGVLWQEQICGHTEIGPMMWFYGVRHVVIEGVRMSVSRSVDRIPPEILKSIVLRDAEGRMNHIDLALLQALDRDLL
jgi:hypothetical protein